jgi:heme A synthase
VALGTFMKRRELNGAYRGALIIGVLLGVVQAVVGLTLLLSGGQPRDNLHFLYGASVILTLPLIASYIVDKRISRPLAYGLGCLFIAGLAIRGFFTGS